MLAECIVAMSIFVIVLSLFFGFVGNTRNLIFERFHEIFEKSDANQLKMLIERDIFVRRRSAINCADQKGTKFCMGFWEETDDELKYIVYDIHINPDSEKRDVISFRRYCMNQNALNGELENYCKNIITAISKGSYRVPTMVDYKDYTALFKGTVYIDGEVLNFNYGDYKYSFPL